MTNIEVKSRLQKIYPDNEVEISHRLLGGMSNYTYVVKVDGEFYTYRIPGENAEKFVDRNIEKNNLELIDSLNISNKTIYFNTETGEKIATYIDGVSLHQVEEYPYKKVSDILKIIHQSGLKAKNDYNPFSRLMQYEDHIIKLGFTHPIEYLQIKEKLLSYKPYLELQEKVLCHGDSQPSNFVLSEDKLYIVDFEFTGNIDLIYDIACFANIRLEEGLKLLYSYFDKVDQDKLKRFYLWRAFQCFQWYNVAIFKELTGLSKALKIDFKAVAQDYLRKIFQLMSEVEKIS
ncbi:MAG TPA: phosphotransferase family protein [Acholeplasmataceae bacterium]|nr:phosphotransferase family protein [Acholeplasmataceae bacterium]